MPTELPRDVYRFWAVLKVHRYAEAHGDRTMEDCLEPLKFHSNDDEIARVGITALTSGSNAQLQERYQLVSGEPAFAAVAKRVALLYPEPHLITPLMSFLVGCLETHKPNLQSSWGSYQ